MVLTEMLPSRNVASSAAVSTAGVGAPVPARVLVTVLMPSVNVTDTLEPDSALTVTTPVPAVAS